MIALATVSPPTPGVEDADGSVVHDASSLRQPLTRLARMTPGPLHAAPRLHRPIRADDARMPPSRDGTAERRCVFELFGRRLSGGRRFGVVAGTGRLLVAARAISASATTSCGSCATRRWWMPPPSAFLEATGFTGSITGYREGELYFPGLAASSRSRDVRRGRRPRDAGAQRAQPRLRHRDGRGAHERGRR